MKKLNYKQFLEKLNISLDYTYLLDKDTISKLDKNKEAFINNLLLVPNVSDKSRDDLLKKTIENELSEEDINSISTKIENIFSNFDNSINDLKVKIREYSKFIIKYLRNDKIENLFKENSTNIDFIFYIIYSKYSEPFSTDYSDNVKYKEVVEFINILNKLNLIKKDNIYYNDLLLYKLISLKHSDGSFTHLSNQNTMHELCKIAHNLFGFEYTKIYTLIECKLVSKDIEGFIEIFNKHFEIMKKWDIVQLLDIFELVVYSKNEHIYNSVNELLLSKDIKMLKGNEKDIYNFLLAVKKEDKLKVDEYIKKLDQNGVYNFAHYNFFKNYGI